MEAKERRGIGVGPFLGKYMEETSARDGRCRVDVARSNDVDVVVSIRACSSVLNITLE